MKPIRQSLSPISVTTPKIHKLSKKKTSPNTNQSITEQSTSLSPLHFSHPTREAFFPQTKASTPSSNSHKKHPFDLTELNSSIVPHWLLERSDFQSLLKSLSQNSHKFSEITNLSSNKTPEEKKILFEWIRTVKFFFGFSKKVLREICEKLFRQNYGKGEFLMKKGENAECMFVVFMGKALVLGDEGVLLETVGARDVIGERVLEMEKVRMFNVVVHEPVVALRLTKIDYDSILMNYKKVEKQKNCKLIMEIPYFKHWTPLKIQHLCNFLLKKKYSPDTIIFDKGQASESFFIIKSGTISVQAHVNFQLINRWPTGIQSWKISEFNRKYLKSICTLSTGQYFGETDLINNSAQSFRAVCQTKVVCLSLDKEQFSEIFSLRDQENLEKMSFVQMPTDEKLEKLLEKEMRESDQNEQAIYESVVVDFNNPDCRESLIDRRTRKMKSWIFSIKKRIKDSKKLFRQRLVYEAKKEVEFNSLGTLKGYCGNNKE